jgi:hypothetical protein
VRTRITVAPDSLGRGAGARITGALTAVVALLAWAAALAGPALAGPALAGPAHAGPALAEAPRRLPGEITDQAAAPGSRGADVQVAITPLPDKDRIKPYVVYAHSFSGQSPTGLELAAIAGAAVALLGLLTLAGRRLSSRDGRGGPGARAAGRAPGPTTAELAAQATHALVATDDAVRTSEQELGFAVARFGEHAAAPFSAALKSARAELATAFKLRQQLDDDIPETEAAGRSMLTEISGRCIAANQLLDEQSEAFDQLQGLEARVPEVLSEVSSHVSQQDERSARSRQTLSQLAARYSAAAVAAVATSPGEAGERLEFARGQVADARKALAAEARGQAAVHLQAAESAADQAEALLDGIEHTEAELTQASSALPTALREIDADIAEGNVLLAGQPDDRAAAVARAQVAASAVRGQLAAGAPFDPLAALRSLEEADTALDHALASARQERERRERARAVLDQAMLVARSSVTAAEDFITTRRGGVGAAARTRLAEARRHFQQAIGYGSSDPEAALAEAQSADGLGQQARTLAEQDVAEFSYEQHEPAVRTGGSAGGFGSAILGGILIDSMFGSWRGGIGLGGLGGMRGLGTLGSFGGIGTRGRHSIGGMY